MLGCKVHGYANNDPESIRTVQTVHTEEYSTYSTVQYSTSFLLARHQLWLGGVLVSLGVGAGVRTHRVTELIEQSVRGRAPA